MCRVHVVRLRGCCFYAAGLLVTLFLALTALQFVISTDLPSSRYPHRACIIFSFGSVSYTATPLQCCDGIVQEVFVAGCSYVLRTQALVMTGYGEHNTLCKTHPAPNLMHFACCDHHLLLNQAFDLYKDYESFRTLQLCLQQWRWSHGWYTSWAPRTSDMNACGCVPAGSVAQCSSIYFTTSAVRCADLPLQQRLAHDA